MPRKIKFRMWSDDGRVMVDGDSLAFEDNWSPLAELLSQDGVMQWTGLRDKHGKEIYEGDIVRIAEVVGVIRSCDWPEEREHVGVVGFADGSFMIKSASCFHYRWMDYEVEVIGNIYETPELLKKEVSPMYDIPRLLAELSPSKAEQLIYELEKAGLVKRLDPSRELAKQLEPVREVIADIYLAMGDEDLLICALHKRQADSQAFQDKLLKAVYTIDRIIGKKAVGQ